MPRASRRAARRARRGSRRKGRACSSASRRWRWSHWVLAPVGEGCVRLGIGANAVSWASLLFGVLDGVAIGAGHSASARRSRWSRRWATRSTAWSRARAARRATPARCWTRRSHRYVELAFLGGLAFYFRAQPVPLLLAIGAIGGSFMVSYATAKAEALQVKPPRGSMRRTERVVYTLAGVTLGPLRRRRAERVGVGGRPRARGAGARRGGRQTRRRCAGSPRSRAR